MEGRPRGTTIAHACHAMASAVEISQTCGAWLHLPSDISLRHGPFSQEEEDFTI